MSQEKKIKVAVPGRVWEDALDPMASAMQGELGLPEPRWVKRGYGSQAVYDDVPVSVAIELADYIGPRAFTLIGQDDPENAHVHRSAMKCAARIRKAAS